MLISTKKFQKIILDYYKTYKRDLPWRKTTDPYAILISEIMLQQTQVDRVAVKYCDFLRAFPTINSLAHAPFHAVLKQWQGLGYNRRSLNLHKTAKILVEKYHGKIPNTFHDLRGLPGIGPYTGNAILAFAFNQPVPVIETNIRSVFIHFFFPHQVKVTDEELLSIIDRTIYAPHPNLWYQALMDYGTMLKKDTSNPTRRSATYTKQSPFKGSLREIRGAIIRELNQKPLTQATLKKKIGFDDKRRATCIQALLEEKMIVQKKNTFSIP